MDKIDIVVIAKISDIFAKISSLIDRQAEHNMSSEVGEILGAFILNDDYMDNNHPEILRAKIEKDANGLKILREKIINKEVLILNSIKANLLNNINQLVCYLEILLDQIINN